MENPRLEAVTRLLSLARIIRRQGKTPDEAIEALEWERKLAERLQQIESGQVAQAA